MSFFATDIPATQSLCGFSFERLGWIIRKFLLLRLEVVHTISCLPNGILERLTECARGWRMSESWREMGVDILEDPAPICWSHCEIRKAHPLSMQQPEYTEYFSINIKSCLLFECICSDHLSKMQLLLEPFDLLHIFICICVPPSASSHPGSFPSLSSIHPSLKKIEQVAWQHSSSSRIGDHGDQGDERMEICVGATLLP